MTAEDTTSFWTDIKKYEDILTNEPNSYCFAPLAELYRKLGLLEDAIGTALRGCELHPEYVGGFMALGRAYFDKGMVDESRVALEKVARVTPDNLLAQKMLSQIYIEKGDTQAAEIALEAILSLNPADMESQILLDSLKRSELLEKSAGMQTEDGWQSGQKENEVVSIIDSDGSIDNTTYDVLIEDLQEAEIVEDENPSDPIFTEQFATSDAWSEKNEAVDPLKTLTMAELYESQGFYSQAQQIYRDMLDIDPLNTELMSRISRLSEIIGLRPAADMFMESEHIESDEEVFDEVVTVDHSVQHECVAVDGKSDNVFLATLEIWLENIRRLR